MRRFGFLRSGGDASSVLQSKDDSLPNAKMFLKLRKMIIEKDNESLKSEFGDFDANYIYEDSDSDQFDSSSTDRFQCYHNKMSLLHIAIDVGNLDAVIFLHSRKADLSLKYDAYTYLNQKSYDSGQGFFRPLSYDDEFSDSKSITDLPTTIADKAKQFEILKYLVQNNAEYEVGILPAEGQEIVKQQSQSKIGMTI